MPVDATFLSHPETCRNSDTGRRRHSAAATWVGLSHATWWRCGLSSAHEDTGGRTMLKSVRDVRVNRSATILRTPEKLYSFWRDFTNLPRFMKHLESMEVIDRYPARLKMAQESGAEPLNFEVLDVLEALKELTGGRGPDACIDAVGMEAHGTNVVALMDYAKQASRTV